MAQSKTDFQQLNLHIEKADDASSFKAIIKDSSGAAMATNDFHYSIDRYVLSRLEDMLSKNFRQSANLIENFGSKLYSAVFGGEVAGYFNSLLKKDDDIRLNLIFKRDQPELYRLPWEFLFDGDKFLCAYPQLNLSRTLEGLETDDKPPIQGKIRILAVVSSPLDLKDYERLQIEQEQVMILQALDPSIAAGKVEVEFLDEASLRNIQERLDEEEYHILHYTGHGVYREDEDRGYLVMEDDTGRTRPVGNRDVADLITGYKSLRLVVLSGCQTAKTSGRQALRDMATPLLTKKIPSVIAMQYSVSDHSAARFATKLYSEIAGGYPVDVALTRARRELRLDDKFGKVEFATPVLWSNNPDCLAIDESKLETPGSGIKLSKPLTLKTNIVLGLERLGNQFIGRRRELRRIKDDFLYRGMRMVVLHGIGGIGKTVTASRVVEKFADQFRLIYAFDCRENLTPELMMLQLNTLFVANGIDVFDPIIKSNAPVTMKINQLAQLLSQIKSLLIFDNFESLLAEDKNNSEIEDDALKKALKDLVTQCSDGSKFLFTSRYTFNLTDGRMTNLIDEINLGELSQPEAVMVMNRFPDLLKETFATKLEIHERIGGHPYTIDIFGRHAGQTSAQDVLADIAGVTRKMVEFTLLDKSYQKLSSLSRRLIDSFAVFRKPAPLEGLEWLLKQAHKEFDIHEIVEEITHWGMIIKVEEEDKTLFQIHTLVTEFIKSKVDKDEWNRRLIKAAEYYEDLLPRSKDIWDYLEARDYYYQAHEYEKAGSMVRNASEYLHRWGLIEYVKKLNEDTVKTTSGETKAAALHHLGMIHQDQGDYEKAIEKYNQSMKIKEELGDRGGMARTLHQLGNIHYQQGDYPQAIEKYNQSMKIAEELGVRGGMAITLHQLGMIHQDQGDYPQALEKYNQSMKIKEELGDRGGMAKILHQLAMIHQVKGDYPQAIEKYNLNMKIKEELGDRRGMAATLHQLGMIHQDQGDYPQAIEKYNQSMKIKEELGDRRGMAQTLHNLGAIHQDQGDYEKAIEKYNQSMKIKEELDDRGGMAATLGQMGRIHEAKKEYKQALKNYLIAHKTFHELKSPNADIAANLIVKLQEKLGEETFKKYYEEITGQPLEDND